MQEARELANDPCTDYAAAPLEVSLPSMASAVPSAHVPALAGRYLREYDRIRGRVPSVAD